MSQQRTQSFGKSLFLGDLREELIFPFPQPHLAEQKKLTALLDEVRKLAKRTIDPRRIDAEAHIPDEVLAGLRELGIFGLLTQPQLGGAGFSLSATARVIDLLGSFDSSVAMLVAVHLGFAVLAIQNFGTSEQRQRYLPRLSKGHSIGAFAVAEPLAGSDSAAIRTRAEPCPGGYRLTGTKIWVQNGELADLLIVFAQTVVHRDGADLDRITAFLVETGPGVIVGKSEPKLGQRGSSTPALYLEDVFVPADRVLGSVGGGFKVAMETRQLGRLLASAACIGTTCELLRHQVQQVTSRRQFGRVIGTLGMIKDQVARTAVDLYASESTLYLTMGLHDLAHRRKELLLDNSLEAAVSKVLAAETVHGAAVAAMRLSGATGLLDSSPYERLLRDSQTYLVFPGTHEVLRAYIALSGMREPGEQVGRLSDVLKRPLRGYGMVVDSLIEKMRTAAYGRAMLTRHHPQLKREAVLIEDATEAFAKEVDRVVRRHGQLLPEMQYVQKRVADVAIDLFAMCACVSRASLVLTERDARHAKGRAGHSEAAGQIDTAERQLRLCAAFCGKAARRIEQTLQRFGQNDDELMKTIADDCYLDQPYPFDALLVRGTEPHA
ncbi:MAG: acyl-CoA dehydrogenase family protein [Deltaproteobacteria bacterium]|nr:acyl-CoA dehydrogenase family protein [Deltaproteobacteria bacterium]